MKSIKFNLKKETSKLMMFVCAAIIALNFNACQKDDKSEEPTVTPVDYQAGNIPGLGDADGDLTGTPFTLPAGVELSGDITGAGYQLEYWDLSSNSSPSILRSFVNKDGEVETRTVAPPFRNSEADAPIYYYGSGAGYVDLLIPLRNTLSSQTTVTFPAATILVSKSGECQNGILLKKVTIIIPSKSDYRVCLSFYCGNLHKHSASGSEVYTFAVISNASPILDLCDRLKNKKINIEEFSRTSYEDCSVYLNQIDDLQGMVWSITEHNGLSQYYYDIINSLPNSK